MFCPDCKKDKPESEFHNNKLRKSGKHVYCKKCRSSRAKHRYERDKEKIKSRNKKWWDNKDNSRKVVLRQHGITVEDYNRMFDSQDGCCAICGKHQIELDHRMYVDHDHYTGEIRGLLCRNCNLAIGLLNDDELLLTKAISYLMKE